MKSLRVFLFMSVLIGPAISVQGQTSLVGNWQLVKQGNCLDAAPELDNDSMSNTLRNDMHSRSGVTAQTIQFKPNATGEESTRILSKGKSTNDKKFLYKFNGDMLLILDKKSQTISDSYLVDKFTADSLIVSNSSRPCETRIFVKISHDPTN